MVYISGRNETISKLMQIDEFQGTAENYTKELRLLNPHLRTLTLDPYVPVILLKDATTLSPELKQLVQECSCWPLEERQQLWILQASDADVPTLVGMHDLMEGFRGYASSFLKHYNDPLIRTP